MAVREVASSPSGKTIQVNDETWGAASATYSSLALALAASSDGDQVAGTEAFEDTGGKLGIIPIEVDIAADNTVRHDGTHGNGYRIKNSAPKFVWAAPQPSAGETIRLINLSIHVVSNGDSPHRTIQAQGAGQKIISGCLIKTDGQTVSTGSIEVIRGYGGSLHVEHTVIHAYGNGGGYIRCFHHFAATNATFYNCVGIIEDGSANNTVFADGGEVVNCMAVDGGGNASWQGYASMIAPSAYPEGKNYSEDGTAPGTDTYDNQTASNDLASPNDPVDAHWLSRARMESFTGVDVSGDLEFMTDFEGDSVPWRTETYIGPDYVPEVSSGTGSPSFRKENPIKRKNRIGVTGGRSINFY